MYKTVPLLRLSLLVCVAGGNEGTSFTSFVTNINGFQSWDPYPCWSLSLWLHDFSLLLSQTKQMTYIDTEAMMSID